MLTVENDKIRNDGMDLVAKGVAKIVESHIADLIDNDNRDADEVVNAMEAAKLDFCDAWTSQLNECGESFKETFCNAVVLHLCDEQLSTKNLELTLGHIQNMLFRRKAH